MNKKEQRSVFRRFADRRNAVMLKIYEILFDEHPGDKRDAMLLESLRNDFGVDRASLVVPLSTRKVCVKAAVGTWRNEIKNRELCGDSLEILLELQKLAPGAVTLTRVKRLPSFPHEFWESLWTGDLGDQATALLSVSIPSQNACQSVLWLHQANFSREWSSQDRELAEEAAMVLAKAIDRELSQ